MKSNMSSLTKKLKFFLVFSIISNFATSDDVQDCKRNVHEVFCENYPHQNFSMAMTALSIRVLTLDFIANNVDELYSHFESQFDLIKEIYSLDDELMDGISDEGIFSSKHKELLEYLKDVKTWQRIHRHSSDGPLSKIHADVMGYFLSFADKIDNIAERIDGIMWSPQVYCNNNKEPEECEDGLRIMLEREDAMEMKGSEALKFCYLNYTYLDFTKEQIFSESGSSSSISSSSVQHLSEQFQALFSESGSSSRSSSLQHSSAQLQVLDGFNSLYLRQMIDYFSYLLDVTTQIGEFNKVIPEHFMGYNRIAGHQFVFKRYQDPPIFFTISKYCKTKYQNIE